MPQIVQRKSPVLAAVPAQSSPFSIEDPKQWIILNEQSLISTGKSYHSRRKETPTGFSL